jgi:hypothetical protein
MAARNDGRTLIFNIILQRLLLALLQHAACAASVGRDSATLRKSNFLTIVFAFTCNEMLSGSSRL